VNECRQNLDNCVRSAENPRSIPQCTEANVRCVADTLEVVLPEIPAVELAECTEKAARCTVRANSPGSVADCARDLRECARGVAGLPNGGEGNPEPQP
jgi:hypothetical protein